MGKRGPAPQPTAVKKLKGNPGKRPLNMAEPKVPDEKPAMPRGVLFDEAKALWRKNVEALHTAGILKLTDGPAYALLCQNYGMAMKAAKLLDEDGLTIDDGRGGQKKHPASTIFSQSSSSFLSLAKEFGMTPSSRGQLKIDAAEQLSLADALFALVNEVDEVQE